MHWFERWQAHASRQVYLSLICILLALSVVPPVAAQPDLPTLAELEAGVWNRLEPGGETICATGTPYSFFVRPVQDSDNLLIYFQGGGACWNTFMCNVEGGSALFDPTVTDEEAYSTGLFDFDHPENPITDYSVVFLPYCTGDVFTGGETVQYSDSLTIEHQGYTNTRAVLDWAYENFDDPAQVLVTGSSAGSLGSIFHAADIMANYPDARVIQLGDGFVGLITTTGEEDIAVWGLSKNYSETLQQGEELPDVSFTDWLYITTARAFPNNILAQFTAAEDSTQVLFYTFMGGTQADGISGIADSVTLLAEEAPNFRYYIAPGKLHTILPRPEFYTLETNGMTVRDWLAALLAGDVENIAP